MRRLDGPPMRLLQRPLRLSAMPLGFEAGNGLATLQVRAVCNLYSITTNQAAIIALFRVMNRYVGNLPPMPGVFPDYSAPVVRNAGAERELTMMRWGMPTASEVRRGARHQHPEYLVAALAWLAEAGEPMPGSLQQFRRICAGARVIVCE